MSVNVPQNRCSVTSAGNAFASAAKPSITISSIGPSSTIVPGTRRPCRSINGRLTATRAILDVLASFIGNFLDLSTSVNGW